MRLGRADEKNHAIYLRKRRVPILPRTAKLSRAETLRTEIKNSVLRMLFFSQRRTMCAMLEEGVVC